MDNQRLFLWIGLAAVLFLNYEVWQRDYARPAAAAETAQGALPAQPGGARSGTGSWAGAAARCAAAGTGS